jgi:hypothetical protein
MQALEVAGEGDFPDHMHRDKALEVGFAEIAGGETV